MVTGQKLASLLERVKNRVEGDLITLAMRKNGQPVHGRLFTEHLDHLIKVVPEVGQTDIIVHEFGSKIKCDVKINNSYYNFLINSWKQP